MNKLIKSLLITILSLSLMSCGSSSQSTSSTEADEQVIISERGGITQTEVAALQQIDGKKFGGIRSNEEDSEEASVGRSQLTAAANTIVVDGLTYTLEFEDNTETSEFAFYSNNDQEAEGIVRSLQIGVSTTDRTTFNVTEVISEDSESALHNFQRGLISTPRTSDPVGEGVLLQIPIAASGEVSYLNDLGGIFATFDMPNITGTVIQREVIVSSSPDVVEEQSTYYSFSSQKQDSVTIRYPFTLNVDYNGENLSFNGTFSYSFDSVVEKAYKKAQGQDYNARISTTTIVEGGLFSMTATLYSADGSRELGVVTVEQVSDTQNGDPDSNGTVVDIQVYNSDGDLVPLSGL